MGVGLLLPNFSQVQHKGERAEINLVLPAFSVFCASIFTGINRLVRHNWYVNDILGLKGLDHNG